MISRRLFGGGLAAALTTGYAANGAEAAAAAAPAAGGAQQERDMSAVANAVRDLVQEVQRQRVFTEIITIREAQRTFLRQNGHLPEFIDVGSDVWFNVHDWHVRWQQPVTLGQDAQGRHTIQLLQTTVVMRPDVLATFVSLPYDGSR
jgi:hypothetical protein